MTVIEHLGNDAFLGKMVPRLIEEPLFDVARSPDVAQAYEPLGKAHDQFVKHVELHLRDRWARSSTSRS